MEIDFSKQNVMAPDADVFLLPVGELFFYSVDACLSSGRPGVFRKFDEKYYVCSFFGWRQWFSCRWCRRRLVFKKQRIEKRKKAHRDAGTRNLRFFIMDGRHIFQ